MCQMAEVVVCFMLIVVSTRVASTFQEGRSRHKNQTISMSFCLNILQYLLAIHPTTSPIDYPTLPAWTSSQDTHWMILVSITPYLQSTHPVDRSFRQVAAAVTAMRSSAAKAAAAALGSAVLREEGVRKAAQLVAQCRPLEWRGVVLILD